MNGRIGKRNRFLRHLARLAAFFLLGMILGLVLASGMPPETGVELRRCLRGRLEGGDGILSEALLFVRGPMFAVLFGLSSAGGLLLCAAAAVDGFLLSFSAGCFTAAFGEAGVLLAASATGIRCLVTLPCFFLLAASFMEAPRRAGRRTNGLLLCVLFCAAVLFVGLCVDLYLTPRLLRWALKRVPL